MRFNERPDLSALARKMRFDEELEGNPKCKECLGRGLIVRVEGKVYRIDKCGCVRPIKPPENTDWAKHLNERMVCRA